jgi:biopolymer transport protein ExbB/TolQ
MSAVFDTSNFRLFQKDDAHYEERKTVKASNWELLRGEAQAKICEQLAQHEKDKANEQELSYYRRRLEELVAQRTEQLEKQCSILKAANANLAKELCELRQASGAFRVR